MGRAMGRAQTLGELRAARYAPRPVKLEMRENLLARLGGLARGEVLFPGIVGYEDSVTPQIANAILSRHNFVLLGLRGQAKSRLLRALTNFLDEEIPVIAGCEINDDPLRPLCAACRRLVTERGDATPVAWLGRERRYVEKLATPDVTIADILGDIDPIKAARGGLALSDEHTIHYGLLPRAHRGIFALNELPDLAAKIQVGLFNVMQEGDIQIKGYPVRLPLDVCLVFTANPEDYTARGKIITPLKDRIGSEIRTHYPATRAEGLRITRQEAWLARDGAGKMRLPEFVAEIVEEIAFQARQNKKIDKRSGVSQRMPITCLENVVSNAERRAGAAGEEIVVPRVGDIYPAVTSLTGKFELEYEGELRGADQVAAELVREAIGRVFAHAFADADLRQVVQWFELGGTLKVSSDAPAKELLKQFRKIQGLVEATTALGMKPSDDAASLAAGCEFVLEGLYAQRKISRNEERGFYAEEPPREPGPARPEGSGPGGRGRRSYQ
jgi:magnesium chelatase subunit I